MKKILLILAVSFLAVTTSTAQKFAYVDTDYILNKIPEFQQAQDKLDAISSDWQKDIENKYADVEQMYRAYQQEQVLLTDEMKTKREEAIINKENDAKKQRILKCMTPLCEKYNCTEDQLLLTWLLYHPSKIYPVIGTTSAKRIELSIAALDIKLEITDWFLLLEASMGEPLP